MNTAITPPLFSVVPTGLFGPLASANRQHYWLLLCRLFDEFFGPEAAMPPSQGLPRREVVAALERYLLADDPWESEEGEAPDTPLSQRAHGVYERFRVAGWLRQDRVGAREMVTMTPLVAQLLATLIDFAEHDPAFVSAKVRSIELQLQQVVEGKAGGDALDEAADQARRLLMLLSSMSLQVRDLMPELAKVESTAQFARQWFEQYVSRFFIGDYADLHRADHPLARRASILSMLRQVETDQRETVLAWYAEHATAGDALRAEQRLQRSLRRVREIERIDEYLNRLDEDIRQANRRALAFLDYRLRAPDRLDVLLKRALRGAAAADEGQIRLPVAPGVLVDQSQLRPPRRRPQPIPRSANVVQAPTPEQLARLSLLRRMKRARLVTAEDLAIYVGRYLPAQGSVNSEQLAIGSIADLRAYQVLLTLALRGSRAGGLRRDDPLSRLLRGFHVELVGADSPADNGYLRASRFIVHRTVPAKPGDKASA